MNEEGGKETPVSLTAWAINLSARLLSVLSSAVRVREITKASDRDIDETQEVFEQLFPEQHRIASSDLTAWLNEAFHLQGGLPPVEHCLLIAKRKGKVIGLLKALYCPQCHVGFLGYFGVLKTDAITRKVASKLILRFFKRYMSKRWQKCVKLVCEIESISEARTKKDKSERRALARLFRDLARRHGLEAYALQVDYFEPQLADASDLSIRGPRMSLLLIPTCSLYADSIPKQECCQLLYFLLMRVYGGTQVIASSRHRAAYQKYLMGVYDGITANLPEHVLLERCSGF